MILNALHLVHFKNFESAAFQFNEKVNCLVGPNGMGKTNVLDAIYLLAFGKSYFNPMATQNIRHGEDFYVVEGDFTRNGKSEKVVCSLRKGQKKVMKRNEKIYDRLADHIGFIPLVIISPSDRDLITESGETRRKFIDGVIAQSDRNYLDLLLQYQRTLNQRNSLLKYFHANQTFDLQTLEVYNYQLDQFGTAIYEKRKIFIEEFAPIFRERYKAIAGSDEPVSLQYVSKLEDHSLKALLEQNMGRDRSLQYTSSGIHRDDLDLCIREYPVKKFGSQGQQKSYLIALKLAQFDFIKERSGMSPILLLDDIFDKLDESRVARLMALVEDDRFGQIFMSDTHLERTEAVVRSTHKSYSVFELPLKS